MKIAVVGAGVFGCVAAIDLFRNISKDVTLFDCDSEIMSRASKINQYRLHRGYHYPRSIETALQAKQGFESFKQRFGECCTDYGIDHWYGLANDSITSDQYIDFMDRVGLKYEYVDPSVSIFNPNAVSAAFKVNEQTLIFDSFRDRIWQELFHTDVKVKLSRRFEPYQLDNYDLVINATYANLNYLLPESEQIDYQFELVEKCVIDVVRPMSGVVLDGDYMCIDPVNFIGWCQVGHVKHAIHDVQVGKFFNFPTLAPIQSKQDLILNEFGKYFKAPKHDYYTSRYVVRTVLPSREHDDARPTYITKHNDKLYSIFSGKIDTVVDISNELIKMLK